MTKWYQLPIFLLILESMKNKVEKIKSTRPQDFYHVCLDHSQTFLISSSSDKFFTVQDMLSGSLIAKGTCGEATTCVRLSIDSTHLITTSSEGIIYFWKLHDSITKAMYQRQNEFDIEMPSLSHTNDIDLEMPPYVPKSSKTIPVQEKKVEEKAPSPNKIPFSGKSPGEILFERNRLHKGKDVKEEQPDPEYTDMTKSQIKRIEVKNIVGEINDIVEGIDDIFTPGGSKGFQAPTFSKEPEEVTNTKKADMDEELAVATGIVPDWAVTQNANIPNPEPDPTESKDTDIMNQIELSNAESGITINPSGRDPFEIEQLDQKESQNEDFKNQIKEDDGDYNESQDPFLNDMLGNLMPSNPKMANNFQNSMNPSPIFNYEEIKDQVGNPLRESITSKFIEGKDRPDNSDNGLTSYKDKRNIGKMLRQGTANKDPLEGIKEEEARNFYELPRPESTDIPIEEQSVEIEAILMGKKPFDKTQSEKISKDEPIFDDTPKITQPPKLFSNTPYNMEIKPEDPVKSNKNEDSKLKVENFDDTIATPIPDPKPIEITKPKINAEKAPNELDTKLIAQFKSIKEALLSINTMLNDNSDQSVSKNVKANCNSAISLWNAMIHQIDATEQDNEKLLLDTIQTKDKNNLLDKSNK